MTKKRKAGDGRRHSRNPDDRQRAQEARRAHQEKVRPLSPQIPRDSRQSVDFITHSIEDGTLYFTVRFKDKTDFSLRYACNMFVVGADFCDFKTGDFEMIREYVRPIPT